MNQSLLLFKKSNLIGSLKNLNNLKFNNVKQISKLVSTSCLKSGLITPIQSSLYSNRFYSTGSQEKLFDQENFQKASRNGNSGNQQPADHMKSYKVTLVDENGNPIDAKFHKIDLLSELKLQTRDLRTVDPSFTQQMPTILVRDKAILLSIGSIRAIIQHNRLILFETQNQSIQEQVLSDIRESLQYKYESMPLPFEFKVFEAILDFVCRKLETEYKRMQNLIEKELQLLNENPEHNLEELLLYHKKGLNQFETSIKEIIDATTNLLESDEDMALMYLSFRNATGGIRKKNLHDEIEILLETYNRQMEQMANNISQLKETLASTEEFVNFQLDTARNKMMRMNLILSLVTLSSGLGGVVAGIFGMNLFNGLEQHPFAFPIAVGSISVVGTITFLSLRYYCQVKSILPYTKKAGNRLKFGVGFRNDSFSNPLREIDSPTNPTQPLIPAPQTPIQPQQQQQQQQNIFKHNSNNLLAEQLRQQQQQLQQQQLQIQIQQHHIQHQQKLLQTNNITSESDLLDGIMAPSQKQETLFEHHQELVPPLTMKQTQRSPFEKKKYDSPTPNITQFWKYLHE
ncbi:putative mitochondrial rna splicing protein [Tieghemostelium lacteum]|uniref:Magnesium transporter n=1 Tax=Tieghemostelium lacteum TaxID=361077 RepID=A0A151Z343_TIELA|nr:putative mitochondrial rna splicing protein [Tieghemostelium lacteum]|eukprot:KYQ88383.1 putative mitochondrial rna splicing protein [Tieghemostelium lacteum]